MLLINSAYVVVCMGFRKLTSEKQLGCVYVDKCRSDGNTYFSLHSLTAYKPTHALKSASELLACAFLE